jgi:uncharacterized membrane protein YGL010W
VSFVISLIGCAGIGYGGYYYDFNPKNVKLHQHSTPAILFGVGCVLVLSMLYLYSRQFTIRSDVAENIIEKVKPINIT